MVKRVSVMGVMVIKYLTSLPPYQVPVGEHATGVAANVRMLSKAQPTINKSLPDFTEASLIVQLDSSE